MTVCCHWNCEHAGKLISRRDTQSRCKLHAALWLFATYLQRRAIQLALSKADKEAGFTVAAQLEFAVGQRGPFHNVGLAR
jgi:hypothetical protein